MIITHRTMEIILLLVKNSNRFISINEIAKELNVTNRTIYRQIEEVVEILEAKELTLLNVSGEGLKIEGTLQNIKELTRLFESNNHMHDLSAEDRLNFLIVYILHENNAIKAEYFAEKMQVSIQTIRNDMNNVNKKIENYDLEIVSRKGEGFLIYGSETKKRILLSNIMRNQISLMELLDWFENKKTASIYLRLLKELNYFEVMLKSFIILKRVLKNNEIQLTDIVFQDYLLFISIMVRRINFTDNNDYYLKNMVKGKNYSIDVYKNLKNLIEQEFSFTLNEVEQNYLEWLLSINNYIQKSETLTDNNSNLTSKVQEFIILVETNMGCNLREDITLYNSLLEHLDRSLARIRSGVTINNPMLKEIKRSYEKLFTTIRLSIHHVFENDEFPEDEIGFIVLHFAVALDKVLDKSITALVVCSSGMGSSKMLANRLKREIPEINIKKVVSFLKLNQKDVENYDVIFSTVTLPKDVDDYMMVSPLLNSKEVKEVKKKLNRIRFNKLHKKEFLIPKKKYSIKDLPKNLDELSSASYYGSSILKEFKVIPINPELNNPILETIGNYLKKLDYTTNSELLLDYANESRLESYFGIPNTKLGYIHCQSNEITNPLFLVFDLEKNVVFSSMEKDPMEVTSVIVVMSPKSDKEIVADMLSMLTMTVIETPESIQLFEECNEYKLRELLSERIKNYVTKIIP